MGGSMTLQIEKQKLIQETFDKLNSVTATAKELGINYRTVIKHISNKPNKRKCDPAAAAKIYKITGSLKRTANILNISPVTVWRNLKTQGINIGTGISNWKRLYATLRRRVSKSQWRQDILIKYDYKCVMCNTQSNIVHHTKKLSDLRDSVVKNYPHIDPFNSFAELRQFTDLVMSLHNVDDGIILCKSCHESVHTKH